MSNISQLTRWIECGNEIEFTLGTSEYSITYSYDTDNKRHISLCRFYEPPVEFDDVSDLLLTAMIDGVKFSELWEKAENIVVY